jgi:hypothetical protein
MQRNEKLVCMGSGLGVLVVILITQYSSCEEWYFDLGNRLETLHNQFDNNPNLRDGLIDDNRVIYQETSKFNTECSIVGLIIPKF